MCLEEHQEETETGDALPLVRLQVSHEFVCLVYLTPLHTRPLAGSTGEALRGRVWSSLGCRHHIY